MRRTAAADPFDERIAAFREQAEKVTTAAELQAGDPPGTPSRSFGCGRRDREGRLGHGPGRLWPCPRRPRVRGPGCIAPCLPKAQRASGGTLAGG